MPAYPCLSLCPCTRQKYEQTDHAAQPNHPRLILHMTRHTLMEEELRRAATLPRKQERRVRRGRVAKIKKETEESMPLACLQVVKEGRRRMKRVVMVGKGGERVVLMFRRK